MRMWQKIVFFLCYVASQVTAQRIKVTCSEYEDFDFPPTGDKACPSLVAGLKLGLVMEGEEVKVNISWAINIDASIQYLTGTWILISGEPHTCEYNPSFAEANFTGSEQVWFHYLVTATDGEHFIDVYNIPLPPLGSGSFLRSDRITVPRLKPRVTTKTAYVTTDEAFPVPTSPAVASTDPTPPAQGLHKVIIIIVGVLAALTLLSSFCICIYKIYRPVSAKYLGVKNLPAPSVVPVPVLVVYPAENSAFQRAVVALAEFLQLHGGCRVAVDMWQQGKIAEMGPLRWLVEQVNAADHVLIVAPQGETPSSLLPAPDLPEHSIPAAAHDLYRLILNMVASHAKSAKELAKFWVVHLNRNSGVFLPELKACKSFYLIKDLDKLCKLLHTPRKFGKKISALLFHPGISLSKSSTAKLNEAIEILGRGRQSVSREILIDDSMMM